MLGRAGRGNSFFLPSADFDRSDSAGQQGVALRATPFFLFAILAVGLSDGYLAGDERTIYGFVSLFNQSETSSLFAFLSEPHDFNLYLQHHFFWFLLQLAQTSLLDLSTVMWGIVWGDELRNWLLVYPLALAACLSIPVAYSALLRLGVDRSHVLLCTGFFYVGGSVVGLLTGGFIECFMLLAVAIRMLLLAPAPRARTQAILLAVVDFTLVAAKLYSLIFLLAVLPATLARLRGNSRYRYLVVLSLLCMIWVLAKSAIPVGAIGELQWATSSPGLSVAVFLTRLGEATGSFSYGLLWTTPVLLLLGIPRNALKPELAQKLLAILALECVSCLYSFWHGAAGMPGQRYIMPYLLVLLPDMCAGLLALNARFRGTSLVVLVSVAIFLPAIDYRHSLADSYADRSGQSMPEVRFGWENLPMLDWSFHPGIFAWRVLIAKWNNETTMPAARSSGPALSPTAIAPMTGIARVILATNSSSPADSRLDHVRQLFAGWVGKLLEFLRGTFILVLFVTMAGAAYHARREIDSSVLIHGRP